MFSSAISFESEDCRIRKVNSLDAAGQGQGGVQGSFPFPFSSFLIPKNLCWVLIRVHGPPAAGDGGGQRQRFAGRQDGTGARQLHRRVAVHQAGGAFSARGYVDGCLCGMVEGRNGNEAADGWVKSCPWRSWVLREFDEVELRWSPRVEPYTMKRK